ncbi:MAG TPA: mechanosensitive ion channel family protein [Verrucomicrobiae bacterium]|jgi:small-conductance mechanosensitive channel|nr:mechanosensitive ion channel family protein [Verrucomicrobiae bacterium]
MNSFFSALDTVILGNALRDYLLAVTILVVGLFVIQIVSKGVFLRLKRFVEKTPSKTDDFIVSISEQTAIPLLYLAVLYFSLNQLALNDVSKKYLNAFCIIILTIQLTRLGLAIMIYILECNWLRKAEASAGNVPFSASLITCLRLVVWGMSGVFIFENLGFNVSAIVAGLGIGGIAVALAAQTILGDLFNYFVIFFDHPFEEGDFIVFDNYMGQIEHIGIKSTRIRSLDGEQIVVSNSNLTSSRIRNYKRMSQRRVPFTVGLTYETPTDKLKKVPEMIRKMIESLPGVKFDRAHFKTFSAYSLDVEVVYFFLSSDYNKYMDVQQQLNFMIKDAFEKEGIEFAYPTQVEYVKAMGRDAAGDKDVMDLRGKNPS